MVGEKLTEMDARLTLTADEWRTVKAACVCRASEPARYRCSGPWMRCAEAIDKWIKIRNARRARLEAKDGE